MQDATTIERNKAVVRRLYEEAWNDRDTDLARELHAESWVHHNPSNPADIEGVDGWLQHMEGATAAFPDLRFLLIDLIAEDDAVVAYWRLTGTHEAAFQGIPPTGERVSVAGFNLHHLEDGRIVEEWSVRDTLGLLEQLGVAPTA